MRLNISKMILLVFSLTIFACSEIADQASNAASAGLDGEIDISDSEQLALLGSIEGEFRIVKIFVKSGKENKCIDWVLNVSSDEEIRFIKGKRLEKRQEDSSSEDMGVISMNSKTLGGKDGLMLVAKDGADLLIEGSYQACEEEEVEAKEFSESIVVEKSRSKIALGAEDQPSTLLFVRISRTGKEIASGEKSERDENEDEFGDGGKKPDFDRVADKEKLDKEISKKFNKKDFEGYRKGRLAIAGGGGGKRCLLWDVKLTSEGGVKLLRSWKLERKDSKASQEDDMSISIKVKTMGYRDGFYFAAEKGNALSIEGKVSNCDESEVVDINLKIDKPDDEKIVVENLDLSDREKEIRNARLQVKIWK